MKRRGCTGRNAKDTGPCQSSAGDGFETCARCGDRRKPRAAKVVVAPVETEEQRARRHEIAEAFANPPDDDPEPTDEEIARDERESTWRNAGPAASIENSPDPYPRLVEHARSIREWTKAGLHASVEKRTSVEFYGRRVEGHGARLVEALVDWLMWVDPSAAIESDDELLTNIGDRDIKAENVFLGEEPPAVTTLASGLTKWNPRWLHFCDEHGVAPDCNKVARARSERGEAVPMPASGINAAFMQWVGRRWEEWGLTQTPPVRWLDNKLPEHHVAFDAWLVERAPRVAGTGPALETDAWREAAEAAEAAKVRPTCGDCGACSLCDTVLAYEDRALAARQETPPAASMWSVTRSADEVVVLTPCGPHALGTEFGDEEAVRVAREMYERDVEAKAWLDAQEPVASPTLHGTGRHQFHIAQADCVAFLRTLGNETIDVIVTDPAYESLEKHRAIGTTTRLTADWFEIFKNERFPELLRECFRVLKRDAHLYVYSDQETMFVTKPMAEAAGFTWWKHLVWSKTKRDSDEPAAGMGYHYRASHEVIGFYEKGKRRLANLGICDVLTAPRVRGYPTEKPVAVSRTLIEQSCPPGGRVLDCFMGSASVGEAALLAGCSFVGCDVAERSLAIARERLTRVGGVEGGPPPGPVPAAQGSLFG